MTKINLNTHELVLIKGRTYRVHMRTPDEKWYFVSDKDGAAEFLSDDEIVKLIGKRLFVRIKADENQPEARIEQMRKSFDSFDEKLQSEARRRLMYIRAYENMGGRLPISKKLKPFLLQIANDNGDLKGPPSWRTFYDWYRVWRLNGARDIRSLLPMIKQRGSRSSILHPEVQRMIEEAIASTYMTLEQGSMAETHQAVVDAVNQWNDGLPEDERLKPPSETTVRRMIKLISDYERDKARLGELAANQNYKYVHGAPYAERPLEAVEIDHTRANVIVLDDETHLPIGRPWLTTAIDRATRMIVGIHVGFEGPSAEAMMACLYNMIRPKDFAPGLIGAEWPCYGLPERIVMDNGKEFHSEQLQDSAAELGLILDYAPVNSPEYKGKIERWHRTVSEKFFNRLPGTTRSGIEDKGDLDPVKNAAILFSDMYRLLISWIVKEYAQTPHRGLLGMRPIKVWQQKVNEYGVEPPPSDADLAVLMMIPEIRTISKKGIEFEGLFYNSRYLNELMRLGHDRVRIRVNRYDLGEIYVLDPQTDRYEPVLAVRHDYANGRTLKSHRAGRALMREMAKNDYSIDELARVMQERRAATGQVASKGLKLRAQAEKEARNSKLSKKSNFKADLDREVLPDATEPTTLSPDVVLNPKRPVAPLSDRAGKHGMGTLRTANTRK
ncbi:Mu transposase C-terminal domain-containing protein [Lacibacterium aquatile]|uniref:Mu transposase C-terminal domain-containing protein n=1 Tax=Lacibacterium aquatile TaxID=1168082 RepID=A0ABW5DRJ8_9PROT